MEKRHAFSPHPVDLTFTHIGRTFILKLINCGRCRRCASGPCHGPYYYERIEKKSGKLIERYIGKKLPPEIPSHPLRGSKRNY